MLIHPVGAYHHADLHVPLKGLCRYASCITVGAYRPRRVTLQQVMVWLTTHFLNPEEVATR